MTEQTHPPRREPPPVRWFTPAGDGILPPMPVTARETAEVLRRRHAQRQQADDARAVRVRQLAVQTLRDHLPPDTHAWLFGSIAWGGFGPRSDVDVAVEGVSPADATRLELDLVTALGLEIDLLRLEELPASFGERIRREGLAVDG